MPAPFFCGPLEPVSQCDFTATGFVPAASGISKQTLNLEPRLRASRISLLAR